jgi:hypothetical protein
MHSRTLFIESFGPQEHWALIRQPESFACPSVSTIEQIENIPGRGQVSNLEVDMSRYKGRPSMKFVER